MSDYSGNKEKTEKIIRQYADMIYRIAFQNLKNRADAEDVFSEVCVVLLSKEVPEEEPHLKHWIIRVTINKCRNIWRSPWRTKTEPIDEHTELMSEEDGRVLEELWQLPERYRNVIYLYYYEKYTINEIAQILGKSPNTISSWLTRARKRLKTILMK